VANSGASYLDLLGTGVLDAKLEERFLNWCVLQNIRPAYAHALISHDLSAEGRRVLAAQTSQQLAALAAAIGMSERASAHVIFAWIANAIQCAVQFDEPAEAWRHAVSAIAWSLMYSQRLDELDRDSAPFRAMEAQIRETFAKRLRGMAQSARS